MKRAALALLVVPLVALWLYGCDKAENPLEAETQASETALFAPGGGKVKPKPLPTGCLDLQVAKYDLDSGEWLCDNDETSSAGGGPAVYSIYKLAATPDFHASPGVSLREEFTNWIVTFPVDVENCAIVALSQEASQGDGQLIRSAYNDPKQVVFDNSLTTFSLIVSCP